MPKHNKRTRRSWTQIAAVYDYGEVTMAKCSSAPQATAQAIAPQADTPQPPYRQLKVEDALEYLDKVRTTFPMQPHMYNQFLDILKEYRAQSIDTPGVIDRVLQLFHGRRELILGFNTFLPQGYAIEFSDDDDKPCVRNERRPTMTIPEIPSSAARPPASRRGGPAAGEQGLTASSRAAQQKKEPIEFDQAINYVTKVKTRFRKEPERYKAFLEILHTYHKEQKTIKEVYKQVSTLFENHRDLLDEFSLFLPDGTAPVRPMSRWRLVSRVVGRLMLAWRRAAERAYAPGGEGFEACRTEFETLVAQ
jgi:paired amphipathic helix protein Sin3a